MDFHRTGSVAPATRLALMMAARAKRKFSLSGSSRSRLIGLFDEVVSTCILLTCECSGGRLFLGG